MTSRTVISGLQEFASGLSRETMFSISDVVNSLPVRHTVTIMNGLRSVTTNSAARLRDPRVIRGKTFRDGRSRDLFFKIGDDLYRLYRQGEDPEPLYFQGDAGEEAETEAEDRVAAAARQATEEIETTFPGVGRLEYFDPADPETWPEGCGVYAFKLRGVHVFQYAGKAEDCRDRLKDYRNSWWFQIRDHLSKKCWFVRVDHPDKLVGVERLVIQSLQPISNIYNKNYDDDEEE